MTGTRQGEHEAQPVPLAQVVVPDREKLLALLYSNPHVSDAAAMAILGIGERQLQKLLTCDKLERAGAVKYHRILAVTIRGRLKLPDIRPEDLSVW